MRNLLFVFKRLNSRSKPSPNDPSPDRRGEPARRPDPEEGFTLLEALVATLLVTIILLTMAPPIILALAMRLHYQKSEQGMLLAQAEVERVRALLNSGSYQDSHLPPIVNSHSFVGAVPAPTVPLTPASTINLYNSHTQVRSEYINQGSSVPDFYIQTFRSNRSVVTDDIIGFHMGVRVYSSEISTNTDGLSPDRDSLTSGLFSRNSHPVAVIYTELVRGDTEGSRDAYSRFLP